MEINLDGKSATLYCFNCLLIMELQHPEKEAMSEDGAF